MGTSPRASGATSDAKHIGLHLNVAVLLRPEVQRNGCKLVHHRHGASILGKIDCLDITAAGVARFYANVTELIGCVDGELSGVLLSTGDAL